MKKRKTKENTINKILLTLIIMLMLVIIDHYQEQIEYAVNSVIAAFETKSYDLSEIPEYTDKSYVVINNNEPNFDENDLTTKSFEKYSELDALNRCGVALANISIDLMPTERRGNIGQVKPTGWHTVKYDIVNGKNLYNRCHLIGYQLTGENANSKNLITCTRYMNTVGMLEFENKVAEYIKRTGNDV